MTNLPPPSTGLPTTAATPADNRYLLALDDIGHAGLTSALRVAAEWTSSQGHCLDSHCTESGSGHTDIQIAAWQRLAAQLASVPAVHNGPELIAFDPQGCRAWLEDGAADAARINDGFNSDRGTIAAGVEELLYLLRSDPQQQVWKIRQPLGHVSIFRTADNDGTDGGGVLAADLIYGGSTIRMASLHQGFDDFTDHRATSGIDAAVQALAHVAHTVNREYVNLCQVLGEPAGSPVAVPDPGEDRIYTVIGIWKGRKPVPVGVIAGDHEVEGGDEFGFPGGLWAICVHARDPFEAETTAVAVQRASQD